MKKIIARYFYAPICPESFASLDRLYDLFLNYKEQVDFESFNVFDCKFESPHSWFPSEEEIIESINENGTYPLLFGKLFIQGNQIKGFPPSKRSISNALQEYDVFFEDEEYKFDYGTTSKEQIRCDINKIQIKRYEEKLLRDPCIVCTKYNPYLDEKTYLPENWVKYEKLKSNFLKDNLEQGSLIGYIGYYEEMPVGFIEAFPLDISKRLGFPISSKGTDGVMITCLSVRKEASGQGVASSLINYLEKEAKEKKYKSIEVLSFSDGQDWQPKSLYEKKGYKKVKDIGELFIMRKEL